MASGYYTITDALGQQIPVMPGQTPQDALAQQYKNLGYTPTSNPTTGQDMTNLTPQWAPLYQQAGLDQAAQQGATVTDPNTGQPISVQQYMQNLPQYQQQRQGAYQDPNAAGPSSNQSGTSSLAMPGSFSTGNGSALGQMMNGLPGTQAQGMGGYVYQGALGAPLPGSQVMPSVQQSGTGVAASPLSQTFDSQPQSQFTYNGSPIPTQQANGMGGYVSPQGAFNNPIPFGNNPSPVQFPQGLSGQFPAPSPFNVDQGNGNQTLGDVLQGFLNQGQAQAQAGQQGMQNVLQNMSGFGQGVQNQLSSALGLTNQMMNQMPATMSWAGQAGTGDLSTQNALVQQLLGATMNPLSGVMNQFQNNNGPLGSGPGLTTNAQNMLNAIGGQLSNPITQSLGLMGQGLNPATSAALQTQAMDQTAQQYNNARQGVMTQLMNQGVMGGGAAMPGGGEAQSLNDLGALSTAQQQQQSQLQQQAILANQSQLNQNNQMGLQAIGQTGNIADMFTGLQQQAAESGYGNMLSGAGITGNLASSLGSIYGQGALGFGNLTSNLYNESMNYPLPYMNQEENNLMGLLGGAQGMGQLGIQGVNSASPFMSNAIALANPGAGSALAGAGLGALGNILSSIL